MDEITSMIDERIKSLTEYSSTLTPGSEEHTKVVNEIKELHEMRIKEKSIDLEREDKSARLELDIQAKDNDEAYRKAQRKDAFVTLGITLGVNALLTGLGWYVYDKWQTRGLHFEQTGTVRSPWTKNLMSRMFPKK